MRDSIPVKQKISLIYLIIILSFLLLAWIVWLLFDASMKETAAKKKEQLSAEIIKKRPTVKPIHNYTFSPVLIISNQHVS